MISPGIKSNIQNPVGYIRKFKRVSASMVRGLDVRKYFSLCRLSGLRRHANELPKRWMRVNRLADHVARTGADHATAQNFSVAVGLR